MMNFEDNYIPPDRSLSSYEMQQIHNFKCISGSTCSHPDGQWVATLIFAGGEIVVLTGSDKVYESAHVKVADGYREIRPELYLRLYDAYNKKN